MSETDGYPEYERDMEPGETNCITNQNQPHGIQWMIDPSTGLRVEVYWNDPRTGKRRPPEEYAMACPRDRNGNPVTPLRALEGVCEACWMELLEGGGCVACPTHGIQPKAGPEATAELAAEGLVACAVCAAVPGSQRPLAQSPPAVDRAFPEDDFGRSLEKDGDQQEREAQRPAEMSRPALVHRVPDGDGRGGPARPVPGGTGAGTGSPPTPSPSDLQDFFSRRHRPAQ
jgi:hypothetical protein